MTPELPLHHYLAVGAVLFALGTIGFLVPQPHRHVPGAEMMLQGVAINLVAFCATAATSKAKPLRSSSSLWPRARRPSPLP